MTDIASSSKGTSEDARLKQPITLHIVDEHISIGSRRAPFVLRRNKRARRLLVRVDPVSGAVVLTLPWRVSEREGYRFLADSVHWIAAQIDNLAPRRKLADGATIPIKGMPHVIRHQSGARGTVWLESGEIHVRGAPEHLPRRIRDWLIREAKAEFELRAQAMAARIGARVRRVSVREMRSRWGSCTSDGRLAFSWRLMLAPEEIIHYLVAHEVAHLRQPDHSPAFWALVRELDPNAMTARRWLKRHGSELHSYG